MEELRIKSATIHDGEVRIDIVGHEVVSYCFFWLRESCKCDDCYNKDTFQRKHDILEIPEDSYPKTISTKSNILQIDWNDAHHSEYTAEFLWKFWPSNWKATQVKRSLWCGNDIEKYVSFVDKNNFLNSEDALKEFLKSLVLYGVAFVTGVSPTLEDTELVIKRVGPVQQTMYGGMWHFTSNMARADTAYTNIYLAPHTDSTYFTEAAGLQVFHCLEHDGTGGETIMVDGFKCADDLKNNHPKAFDVLTNTLQEFESKGDGHHHRNRTPVIVLDPITKELIQIRYNNYDRSDHYVRTGKEAVDNYTSYKAFAKLLNAPEAQWKFKLTPGHVVFIDNYRVLHGRAGFTGKRYMGGAYVPRSEWLSAARVHGIIP